MIQTSFSGVTAQKGLKGEGEWEVMQVRVAGKRGDECRGSETRGMHWEGYNPDVVKK